MKNYDKEVLDLINKCEYKEEAMELLTYFFFDKPVKLNIVHWFAFNNLRDATHPFKKNQIRSYKNECNVKRNQ